MIRLENVEKSFRAYTSLTAKETLAALARRRRPWERRPVIRGLDLVVQPGERVAVVGKNGAGKSTLFRLMCGILEPDRGAIDVRGRVSPLIELTAGLVPDLTGAENIRLNAMLLGIQKRDLARRFEEIVRFADIAEFLDTPVRYYSSGMTARLGFAVAVHVDADVLLIDEVLAVGDLEFQRRCLERLAQLGDAGATIVFISHDLTAVEKLCRRAVWLAEGRIIADGPVHEVCAAFAASLQPEDHDGLPSASIVAGSG